MLTRKNNVYQPDRPTMPKVRPVGRALPGSDPRPPQGVMVTVEDQPSRARRPSVHISVTQPDGTTQTVAMTVEQVTELFTILDRSL